MAFQCRVEKFSGWGCQFGGQDHLGAGWKLYFLFPLGAENAIKESNGCTEVIQQGAPGGAKHTAGAALTTGQNGQKEGEVGQGKLRRTHQVVRKHMGMKEGGFRRGGDQWVLPPAACSHHSVLALVAGLVPQAAVLVRLGNSAQPHALRLRRCATTARSAK